MTVLCIWTDYNCVVVTIFKPQFIFALTLDSGRCIAVFVQRGIKRSLRCTFSRYWSDVCYIKILSDIMGVNLWVGTCFSATVFNHINSVLHKNINHLQWSVISFAAFKIDRLRMKLNINKTGKIYTGCLRRNLLVLKLLNWQTQNEA